MYKLKLDSPVNTTEMAFERDAEFRSVQKDEWYLDGHGHVYRAAMYIETAHIVLTPKRWRAKGDERYYYVRFGVNGEAEAMHTSDRYDANDNIRYKLGNYFSNLGDAEAYAGKISKMIREAFSGENSTC